MTQLKIGRKRYRSLTRDSAPHLLECLLNLASCFVQTRATRLLAWWWRVQLAPGCTFYGLPLFRRLPGSEIRVGAKSQFRSSQRSNLVGINRPCMLSTLRETARIEIGRKCGFSGTVIGCASLISIGDRVLCGANVTITDTDWHPLHWRDRASGQPSQTAPVIIHDDVWLGMNVTVLKGVEIGRGTIIGAGSVVTRSLPAGVIAAGQPAIIIRELRAYSDQTFTSLPVEECIQHDRS